jgi:hypothetical protein
MGQVIIFTNSNGNVSVCRPTGEIPIEEVLVKDCPKGAIIVDDSYLPYGEDDFFDAWQLNNGIVTLNFEIARSIHLEKFNANALEEAVMRRNNTDIGISNTLSDADFVAMLNAKREAITAATSTAELRAIGLN